MPKWQNRTLKCSFEVEFKVVRACYIRLSDPGHIYLIESRGDDLVFCFLEAVGEVPDLTPGEVKDIASQMSIPLPPFVLSNLIKTQGMINQLVQAWRVKE